MKKKAVVLVSIILSLLIILGLVIGSVINNAGKITKISFEEKNADTAELSINYSFGVGGYSVSAVSETEGEFTGDGMTDYDGSLGEYRILIEFGDVSLGDSFKGRVDENVIMELSDNVFAKVAHPSGHGFALYVGFDKPISIEAQKGVKLNSLGGTIKIPITFKNNSVEEIYNDFLSGKTKAAQSGSNIDIEYLKKNSDGALKYGLFDRNGDSVPELCFDTGRYLTSFWVSDGVLTLWREENFNSEILNNGNVLETHSGGAPNHTDYTYYVCDYKGKVVCSVTYSVLTKNEEVKENRYFQYISIYNESLNYKVDEIEITEEIFDNGVEKIEKIGEANIDWKTAQ